MSGAAARNAPAGLLQRRWIAWLLAALLIVLSIALAWQREQAQIEDQSRSVSVQASILGSSAAGALAFDDADALTEYVNALKLDQGILAAGIYGDGGPLVAGLAR